MKNIFKKVFFAGTLLIFILSLNSKVMAATNLAKPKITSAKLVGIDTVELKWKNVNGASKYNVFCSTGGSYKKIATVKKLIYKHKKVALGKICKYKIQAVKGAQKSKYSSIKSVKTMSGSIPKVNASIDNNMVMLKWKKVKNATGYYVYRGKNKIGSTSDLIYKDSGASELGKKYTYKVVPYIKSSGKKYSGNAGVATITTNDWCYMLDVMKPYKTDYCYTEYNDAYFNMAGDRYTKGFVTFSEGSIYFNLHGQYNSLSFDVGLQDDRQVGTTKVVVYGDGNILDSFNVQSTELPKHRIINVRDCVQLKISVDNDWVPYIGGVCGFANVILSTKAQGKIIELKDYPKQNGWLVDIMKPYYSSNHLYDYSTSFFNMSGDSFSKGFVVAHYNKDEYIYYNLHHQYSKLSFDVGNIDVDEDGGFDGMSLKSVDYNVYLYGDGTLLKSIKIPADGMPQHITVSLKHCGQLKILTSCVDLSSSAINAIGFGNLKLEK